MRPLLAAPADDETLKKHLSETYLYVSRKYDGIRALKVNGELVSRTLKPIRNKYTQECFKELPDGLDGELIVGKPNAPDVFNKTTSGVMSYGGEPDVKYYVFDLWDTPEATFRKRRDEVRRRLVFSTVNITKIVFVAQWSAHALDTIHTLEQRILREGYEGAIVRRPDAPYKFNRSTAREGYLLKIKRYADAEAEIIGVTQKFHNANPAEKDALGLTRRSSSKEHKVPIEQVGAFEVRDLKHGWVFEVHGFSHADAEAWWKNRDSMIGKIITYRYLPVGMIDVPRHPIFKGFRDPIDIDTGD